MELDIWVEAENMLGKAESEHLIAEADSFGKLKLVMTSVVH